MAEKFRIGLDVVPLRFPPSGVRTYVEALIEAFRNRDSGIDLVPMAAPSGVTRRSSRLSRLRWDLQGVSAAAESAHVELLHMTRFAAPWATSHPLVVTVHDLIPVTLAEYRKSTASRLQSELARRAVTRASRIIVPTRFVASEVERLLGVDPRRIDVIPMGVSVPDLPPGSPPISGPYVIHTGGFDARKNLPVLIEAFAEAAVELGSDWRLVLVGAPHTSNRTVYPPIGPAIEASGLRDRVVLTGRVSEREKHALYRHAALAVAPSLSEGFGLSILEAMAHGVPVIASNHSSHPEVAGDAALLVEPTTEALAEAMVRLGSDAMLMESLGQRGLRRAANFPWSRTADLTRESYQRALEAGGAVRG